jgi:hypothetical protein
MTMRTWQLGSAVLAILAVWGPGTGRAAFAADETAPLVVRASDDDCDECCDDDDCDGCRHHRRCCCCRLCLCRKLKLHCIYFRAAKCRPYRMLPYTPPELAPYIGPGTYSFGYDGGASALQGPPGWYPGYGECPVTVGPAIGYVR